MDNPFAKGAPKNSANPNSTEVDPATWRLVNLDMASATGDYLMKLLEPTSWIKSNSAKAGGWVALDLPELQINGEAQVTSIAACPEIQAGPGRVVLGTFQHVSHDLVDVKLVGDDSPLRVTSGHKLWSLDRGDWVQAGDLRNGERLATEHGDAVVKSVIAEAGATTVYNLDVETDHRYFVGRAQVVTHNVNECPTDNSSSEKLNAKLNSEELTADFTHGGAGIPLAGKGAAKALYPKTLQQLTSDYGGLPGDWAKMGGPSRTINSIGSPFKNIEGHWYENAVIGQRVEFKIKIVPG